MRALFADIRAVLRDWGALKLLLLPVAFIWLLSVFMGAMAQHVYAVDYTTDFERYPGYCGQWSPDDPTGDERPMPGCVTNS